jgi:hypothetical protein
VDKITLTIDNPDRLKTVTVNESGQAYLGTELAGQDVQLVMKVVDETD